MRRDGREAGRVWRRWCSGQEAGRLSSPTQAAPSGVPSRPHGTVGEEFAEVHFRVATSGQELLCSVLEFLVVLTNFGGKKLLPLI